jgi:cell wall-associated NlpC family hydrolase
MDIRKTSDRMKIKHIGENKNEGKRIVPEEEDDPLFTDAPGTGRTHRDASIPGEHHKPSVTDPSYFEETGWVAASGEEAEQRYRSTAKSPAAASAPSKKEIQTGKKRKAMTAGEYADRFYHDPDAYLTREEQRKYARMTPDEKKEVMTGSYRRYARDAAKSEREFIKEETKETKKAAAEAASEGGKILEDSTVGAAADTASPAAGIIRQGVRGALETGKKTVQEGYGMSKEVARLSDKSEAFNAAVSEEQMKQAQGIGKVTAAAGTAVKTGADAVIGVARAAVGAATGGISILAELIIRVLLVLVIAIMIGIASFEIMSAITTSISIQQEQMSTVTSATGEAIAAYAKQFIGVPYVWGSEDLNVAVDCSGFVRAVMAHFGIDCHGADAQGFGSGAVGTRVASIEEAIPSDIIFWPDRHVGIYLGNGEAIQSSGGQANYDLAHAGPGVSIRSATYRTIGSIWRVVTDTAGGDASLDGLNVTDLGQWRLTAYCNCPICCGSWSGGPTASGVMPTAGKTIAIAASTMSRLGLKFGDRIYINGHIYTLEDNGGSEMARSNNGLCIDIYVGKHSDCYNAAYNGMAEAYLVH